jgi:ribosomal protein L29
MTKITDIRKKTESELAPFIREKREALRQMRFATSGSKGRDVKAMRENKKDVARAFTVLQERSTQK